MGVEHGQCLFKVGSLILICFSSLCSVLFRIALDWIVLHYFVVYSTALFCIALY